MQPNTLLLPDRRWSNLNVSRWLVVLKASILRSHQKKIFLNFLYDYNFLFYYKTKLWQFYHLLLFFIILFIIIFFYIINLNILTNIKKYLSSHLEKKILSISNCYLFIDFWINDFLGPRSIWHVTITTFQRYPFSLPTPTSPDNLGPDDRGREPRRRRPPLLRRRSRGPCSAASSRPQAPHRRPAQFRAASPDHRLGPAVVGLRRRKQRRRRRRRRWWEADLGHHGATAEVHLVFEGTGVGGIGFVVRFSGAGRGVHEAVGVSFVVVLLICFGSLILELLFLLGHWRIAS